MTDRMAKLDRMLALVHALSESAEGLTLDEMAERLGVNRRTAERMRGVIRTHFELEERQDERHKRFFIRESLRRVYTRPTAAEIAALQAEVEGHGKRGQGARQAPLASLLAKVRSAMDDRERRRLDPDLEALARLQRAFVPAGPAVTVAPETLAAVQGAILAGQCVEFDYVREPGAEPQWRRVIPYGLVHGAVTYLVGKMPGREQAPVFFRLDRMRDTRASNTPGCPPDDWDLDAWMGESFGIWRDSQHDIVLRILPGGVARARGWRFHPAQTMEEGESGTLRVRFRAGGLRELAEHLFAWGGELVIEGPEELRAALRDRLAAAANCLGEGRPLLSQHDPSPTA
jgi:proteasome accessory factor B